MCVYTYLHVRLLGHGRHHMQSAALWIRYREWFESIVCEDEEQNFMWLAAVQPPQVIIENIHDTYLLHSFCRGTTHLTVHHQKSNYSSNGPRSLQRAEPTHKVRSEVCALHITSSKKYAPSAKIKKRVTLWKKRKKKLDQDQGNQLQMCKEVSHVEVNNGL